LNLVNLFIQLLSQEYHSDFRLKRSQATGSIQVQYFVLKPDL